MRCLTSQSTAPVASRRSVTCYPTTLLSKVSKGAKNRNRYNQVPHLTQDTNGKVTNSQLEHTNESQEVSLFPAGDHKAQINRRAQRHNKHKTEKHLMIHKKYQLGTVSKNILLDGLYRFQGANLTLNLDVYKDRYLVCMKYP